MIYTGNRDSGSRSNKPRFKIGIFIVIAIFIAVSVRMVCVFKNSKEDKTYFYAQLLNIELPVIGLETEDEMEFTSTKMSIHRLFFDSLGLQDITYGKMLTNELSIMQGVTGNNYNYTERNKGSFFNNPFSSVTPFTLSDESISKDNIPICTNTDIYNPDIKKTLDSSKPEVLIYHSHIIENFGTANDSLNEETNIAGAGDVIENELRNNYGIEVIHDKTNYSRGNYNNSYASSRVGLNKWLKECKTFKVIIDLHRDSTPNKAIVTTDVFGNDAAKFRTVESKASPNFNANLAMENKIQEKAEKLFPGLCYKKYSYNHGKGNFNLDASDKCMLIELGSYVNTPEESRITAQCLARIIAEVIHDEEAAAESSPQ